MATIRGVKDRRFKFTQILNSMFDDPDISLKCKGFIGYCLSKTESWEFQMVHLCKVLKEGEDAIYSTINECIKYGYAYRYRIRDSKGQLSNVEFIISDSKEEIQKIKKERDETNELNKKVPHRDFPDVDSPHRENPGVDSPGKNPVPIYSNTDVSNTEKQQQQEKAAAAFLDKKQEETKSTPLSGAIHTCLKNIDMPHIDKIEITQRYSEDCVKYAIEWATHPQTKLTKGLVPAIKWACSNKPEMPKTKTSCKESNTPFDFLPHNRGYWNQINKELFKNGVRIQNLDVRELNEYLETKMGRIYFKDASFLEQTESFLRKKGVVSPGIFKFIDTCRRDLEKCRGN